MEMLFNSAEQAQSDQLAVFLPCFCCCCSCWQTSLARETYDYNLGEVCDPLMPQLYRVHYIECKVDIRSMALYKSKKTTFWKMEGEI